MTDRFDELDLPEEELDALAGLLSQETVWGDRSGGDDRATEDAIVAAIAAERAETPVSEFGASRSVEQTAEVIPIDSRRRALVSFVAGAAAAIVVFVGVFAITQISDDSDGVDGVQLALDATELAPEATATVVITDTPQGTKIVLDVDDLPPAAPGTYYEAWLRVDGETGVSAGTFHLRGGDAEIELWAGVSTDEFPLFTITIQDEAQPESSGVVVLRGLVEPEE